MKPHVADVSENRAQSPESRVQSPIVQVKGQKIKRIKKKKKDKKDKKKKPRDTLEVTSSVETHSACP